MSDPRPRGDHVLVSVLDDRERPSGVLIPVGMDIETVPSRGTILYVGPGFRCSDGEYLPLDLRPGDEVLFLRSSGISVQIGGEDMLLLRDTKVLVVTDPASVMQEQDSA